MVIAIPVENDNGLDSTVCGHFGSAPLFLLVNTSSMACQVVPNTTHHVHGQCRPVDALANLEIDGATVNAIVVGGIGMGALNRLSTAGLGVYRSTIPTARATVDAFNTGSLTLVAPGDVCGHEHGHGHGHDHDHGHHHH